MDHHSWQLKIASNLHVPPEDPDASGFLDVAKYGTYRLDHGWERSTNSSFGFPCFCLPSNPTSPHPAKQLAMLRFPGYILPLVKQGYSARLIQSSPVLRL